MSFPKIEVPDVQDGLKDAQRDKLLIEMAQGFNYVGNSVCKLKDEVHGDEDSPGLKKLSHSSPCQPCVDNREKEEEDVKGVYNRIWWLVGILLAAGGGGSYLAFGGGLP